MNDKLVEKLAVVFWLACLFLACGLIAGFAWFIIRIAQVYAL